MKPAINRAVSGVGLLLLCGCVGCFKSKQPLTDPDMAEIHAGIIGTWIWKNTDFEKDEWSIDVAGDGFPKGMLRISVVHEGKTETIIAFSSKIEDAYYLNAVNFKDDVLPAKWNPQQVDDYTLLPYNVSKNTFTATLLNDGFLRRAINTGKITGRIGQGADDETRLTATTDELRAFFAAEKIGILDSHTETAVRKVAGENAITP